MTGRKEGDASVWFRLGALRWAGLGVGLLGAALVIVARSAVEAPTTLGLLCAVGGLLAVTAGALYESRFGTGGNPVTSNVVQYAVGLAGTLPLAWAFEGGAWSGRRGP